jgi:SARP family transcriptional regulator, regulator of embCAB operon
MFAVLGPIEITVDGRATLLRSEAQRSLFAALLANRGNPVGVHTLISELWEDPPRGAENALQAHVSRLRRRLAALEPDRNDSRLITVPPGYQLSIDDDELDAAIFKRRIRQIQNDTAMPASDVADTIRQALSLWRGPAFGGQVRGALGQSLVARYEQARLSALGRLYDSELKLGRDMEIVAELSELVELEPLNERFCEQLMIALYRSGRQADALAAYRRLRTRMDNELGVEPSPAIRKFEVAVLAHDPKIGPRADHLALRS